MREIWPKAVSRYKSRLLPSDCSRKCSSLLSIFSSPPHVVPLYFFFPTQLHWTAGQRNVKGYLFQNYVVLRRSEWRHGRINRDVILTFLCLRRYNTEFLSDAWHIQNKLAENDAFCIYACSIRCVCCEINVFLVMKAIFKVKFYYNNKITLNGKQPKTTLLNVLILRFFSE